MAINNFSLLSLTNRKNINISQIAMNRDDVVCYNAQNSFLTEEKHINIADKINIDGKEKDVICERSDEEIIEMYEKIKQNAPEKLIVKDSEIKPSELADIKKSIYNLYGNAPEKLSFPNGFVHIPPVSLSIGTQTNPTNNDPNTQDDTSDDDENSGNDNNNDVIKTTFLTNQYASIVDTDSMFVYFHNMDSSITKTTGITRAQLIKFTQEDDYEDSNYDFFGTLNRIFLKLDIDKNEKLTADEIEAFIGNELGTDALVYLTKVNQFAQEIQNIYSTMTSQQKLEFVLARTKEYLESAELTKQVQALERLTNEQDKVNPNAVAKKGQIVLTTFDDSENDYITLGAYNSAAFPYTYDDVNEPDKPFTGSYFAFDNDENDNDRGITLNEILLERNWYELVDTLVHELTHATAWLYYPNPACEPADEGGYYLYYSMSSVDELRNLGVIEETEYNTFKEAFKDYSFYDDESLQNRLSYLLECQWGEYAAYQVDADYMDSIAGDIYDYEYHVNGKKYYNDWGNGGIATAVNGNLEKNTISEHIDSAYNYTDVDANDEDYSKEVRPDYKWWTYRGTLA